jgi:hypothetical protein
MSAEQPAAVMLIPVYNDWECAADVLRELDAQLEVKGWSYQAVIVNDGSQEPPGEALLKTGLKAIASVKVINLCRNLGHQRALATGRCWVVENVPCAAIVVMDGDGEDMPAHVPALLASFASDKRCAVFAARTRRTESLVFQLFYHLYRLVLVVLTGVPVRIGNFSVISRDHAASLVTSADLWNHYAAAAVRSRLPIKTVPLPRGRRFSGQSRMRWASLVIHGLSAASVFGDVIGVRLLTASLIGLCIALPGLCLSLATGGQDNGGHLGNAAILWAFVTLLLVQLTLTSVGFILSVLSGRSFAAFIPLGEYARFVRSVDSLWPRNG